MRIAHVHLNDPTALTVFDNLHVGPSPWDAIAHLWRAASTSFSALSIGHTENLWKQALITGFAVREQNQMMAIGQSLGAIFQQGANPALIAPSLDMGKDEFA